MIQKFEYRSKPFITAAQTYCIVCCGVDKLLRDQWLRGCFHVKSQRLIPKLCGLNAW